jgi:DNA-directed RNA polymerase specialized sigma24 family protein
MHTREFILFEELVLRNLDFLYDCAIRKTGNTLKAEKVVQRTVKTAHAHFSLYNRDGDFRKWIGRILSEQAEKRALSELHE